MATMERKKKGRLLDLLREKSYRYRSKPLFKLVSGRESPHYVDCKPTTHSAEGITLIGEIFFDRIRELDVSAIGGLTMGADPIAHATSVISHQKGKPVSSFAVRRKPKEHGIPKMVEGDVQPGQRVVIVDDVITTGGSTIKAIDAARAFGLEIVRVLVLVDREEGGREAIEKLVPDVEPVFTLSDLRGPVEDKELSTEATITGEPTRSHQPI